jgi:hypothetical protein
MALTETEDGFDAGKGIAGNAAYLERFALKGYIELYNDPGTDKKDKKAVLDAIMDMIPKKSAQRNRVAVFVENGRPGETSEGMKLAERALRSAQLESDEGESNGGR